jgi:transposase
MRKAYDGLSGEVREYLKQDPLSGSMFVFMNRARNRMKILVWERHGFWLLCKRLEAGRFQAVTPQNSTDTSAVLTYEQLLLIIEGIDLHSVRHRKRFALPMSRPEEKSFVKEQKSYCEKGKSTVDCL